LSVSFRSVPLDAPDAVALLAEYGAEIAGMYDGVDVNAPGMPKAGPDELGPPSGRFLIGYDEAGAARCCGGFKRLPDGACEIKRMYVVPAARRGGLARALLHALEDAARELGYAVARMDTGPKHGHAIAFYEREGYAPVGNFNNNPVATWFGEKTL
jgi:GNAT superfamily N-acetyltransferase